MDGSVVPVSAASPRTVCGVTCPHCFGADSGGTTQLSADGQAEEGEDGEEGEEDVMVNGQRMAVQLQADWDSEEDEGEGGEGGDAEGGVGGEGRLSSEQRWFRRHMQQASGTTAMPSRGTGRAGAGPGPGSGPGAGAGAGAGTSPSSRTKSRTKGSDMLVKRVCASKTLEDPFINGYLPCNQRVSGPESGYRHQSWRRGGSTLQGLLWEHWVLEAGGSPHLELCEERRRWYALAHNLGGEGGDCVVCSDALPSCEVSPSRYKSQIPTILRELNKESHSQFNLAELKIPIVVSRRC